MNKRLIILIFLVAHLQVQPLWELPAAVLAGMFLQTAPGKVVTRYAFSKTLQAWKSSRLQLGAFSKVNLPASKSEVIVESSFEKMQDKSKIQEILAAWYARA